MKFFTSHRVRALLGAVFIAPVVLMIGVAVLSLPAPSGTLPDLVAEELVNTGVTNPVTAVLLNFRSYDTLLEIAVLLLALLGARVMAAGSGKASAVGSDPASPMLTGLVRIIGPALAVAAGYILWAGGHAPGGAFQAGAILASLGVVLLLSGVSLPEWYTGRAEPWVLASGLLVFLAAGVGVLAFETAFLQYPKLYAKWIILLIEGACMLSIGATLYALFGVDTQIAEAAPTAHREGRES